MNKNTASAASRTRHNPSGPTVVILGANGQLGRALQADPKAQHYQVVPLDRQGLDITDGEAGANSAALAGARVIINAAAATDVDGAETEPGSAHVVNALGPKFIAERARQLQAYLIHISTDYVFGNYPHPEPAPWKVSDPTVPSTIYGRTKLVGETNVRDSGVSGAIVRTAWVWSGPTQPEARDFVSTMMRLAASGRHPRVVADQIGNPTFVGDLAAGLWQLVEKVIDGRPPVAAESVATLHATGTGQASWWELARAVFSHLGYDPEVVQPVTSDEYPTPAARPAWSVLDGSSWCDAGLDPLPEWQATLARVLA